ncbi:MAG: hypothetical protein MZV63_28545 [Marinilabiliales bacterium]|nr:hypothetical protein [Marinilabiliales bacterium]
MMYDVCGQTWLMNIKIMLTLKDFKFELITNIFASNRHVNEDDFQKINANEIGRKAFIDKVLAAYKRKVEAIAKQAFPVIKDVL